MVNKDWTWDDYEYLYQNYNIIPTDQIAEHLGRSVSSVVSHAERLGLFPMVSFPKKDLMTARSHAAQLGTALTFLLPAYSTYTVKELIKCVENSQ